MTRKTEEEMLQELEKKIEQMKEKKKQVKARLNEKERKKRTRRLIQIGALFEKHFDAKDIEIENAEKILTFYGKHYMDSKNKKTEKPLSE